MIEIKTNTPQVKLQAGTTKVVAGGIVDSVNGIHEKDVVLTSQEIMFNEEETLYEVVSDVQGGLGVTNNYIDNTIIPRLNIVQATAERADNNAYSAQNIAQGANMEALSAHAAADAAQASADAAQTTADTANASATSANDKIGTLSQLKTEAKSNLVAAVNELAEKEPAPVSNEWRVIANHTVTAQEYDAGITAIDILVDTEGKAFDLKEFQLRYRIYKVYDEGGTLKPTFTESGKDVRLYANYNGARDNQWRLITNQLITTNTNSQETATTVHGNVMSNDTTGNVFVTFSTYGWSGDINSALYGNTATKGNLGGQNGFSTSSIKRFRIMVMGNNVIPKGSVLEIWGR